MCQCCAAGIMEMDQFVTKALKKSSEHENNMCSSEFAERKMHLTIRKWRIDDKAIGSIGVFRQDNIHCKTAEMGYYVGEPYWRNGYTANAIKQVCEYVRKRILFVFMLSPLLTI